MAVELIRDTAFGQLLRLATGGRVMKYAEERDPNKWKWYVDEEKSGNLARHGQVEKPEDAEDDEREDEGLQGVRTREGLPPWNNSSRNNTREDSNTSSQQTRIPDDGGEDYNEASGRKVHPEKGKNIHLVTFMPDDPDNPMNWPKWKKFFVTGTLCLLTFAVYIGSAIYTPAEQGVEQEFQVSQEVATIGLTCFVAGYGLGPMIWSPMSEIPYIGRNPIYIGTLIVFVALQVPTALASNIGMLLAFRFLTGFFGSPVLATGGASIGDMYTPAKRAYGIGVWGLAAVSGPALGPLVAGFAIPVLGWEWAIWELMILSGACLVFCFFFLPETSSANILYRRTKRLRKATGDDKLKCEPEMQGEEMKPKDIVMMSLVRPFTLNFTEPMVFLLNLYIALIYGLLYVWFESFPIVFIEIYGFNEGELGLAFLGILVGSLIIIWPYFAYVHWYLEPRFDEDGNLTPELRLPPAFIGAFCVPICLFWFGWSARPEIHWIMPIIGSAWFSFGAVLLFMSVLNYLPDAYPEYAASVLAGNDLFRSAFGAGFPLFGSAMYTNLGVGWASSTLAFISITFIPIPFLLFKYGGNLRNNHSKHARKDKDQGKEKKNDEESQSRQGSESRTDDDEKKDGE